ncbi:MAG: hypothetical protein U0R71_15245 [Solirubrobacterales bacterium]
MTRFKVKQLDVSCRADGRLEIVADSLTAALLAGRHDLGDVEAAQALFQGRIADSWYRAGCPPAS